MNRQFENDLQKTLSAGAARIDQPTRDELARRRRHALEVARQPMPYKWLWMPVAGLSAALLAVFLVQPFVSGQLPEPVAADADDLDMEILLAEEEFDLYEDLEFYEWLVVDPDAG